MNTLRSLYLKMAIQIVFTKIVIFLSCLIRLIIVVDFADASSSIAMGPVNHLCLEKQSSISSAAYFSGQNVL